MRLSRPCYDKPHRCPGRNGGGMTYPKVYRCEAGFITTSGRDRYGDARGPAQARWRFGRCNECDVVTWPWVTRRLDPSHWRSEIAHRINMLRIKYRRR